MKLDPPHKRKALSIVRLLLVVAAVTLIPLLLYGSAPSWWSHRGVLSQGAVPDDYAPVNQGQLKNIAKAAVAEMDDKLPGGAGETLHGLIASWSVPTSETNDFAPVNLGQLKNVAKPFYDRLIAAGAVDFYPWLASVSLEDDFAVADIGQVKNLFGFQITTANTLDDPLTDRVAASQRAGNLALEAQAVWFWGNRFGGDYSFEKTYPKRLSGLPALRSISSGDDYLVVLGTDGTVLSWGKNNLGQLGDGTNVDRAVAALVPNLVNIISVKAGGAHTLALQQDGTILAWGDNYYGQLGTGDNTPSSSPIQVAGLTGVRKIAAGPQRSVALKEDGTVWTWGYDHYNSQTGEDVFNSTPAQVNNFNDVVDVAAGYEHVVAVKADGTVWAWGSNYSNQIGNGNQWWQFQDVPAQVPNLANVVKVAAGLDHTLALLADGTVWAWGVNNFGQLGDGTIQPRQSPVQVVGLTNVIAIAAAWPYSLAMKSDGTVWTWGEGSSGTLPNADLHVPQQVGLGLYDTDHDGMDDRWETEYFGSLNESADGDADGDGISNLKEYLRGTDPRDYFNGVAPVIEIASGNNQVGDPGSFLPKPLKVRVRDTIGRLFVDAPVTFAVTNGSGGLATAFGAEQQSEAKIRTDPNGEAYIYLALADTPGISTRTAATAGSASAVFRSIGRLVLPPLPTPPPDPNVTPASSPSPTATPHAAYRYAIIDLGKEVYPTRLTNSGWVLHYGYTAEQGLTWYRWKAGSSEALQCNNGEPYCDAQVNDINEEGTAVGRLYGAQPASNEPSVGAFWRVGNSASKKVESFPVSWRGPFVEPAVLKYSACYAVDNSNAIFGQAVTEGIGGKVGERIGFYDFGYISNSCRWSLAGGLPAVMSNAKFKVMGQTWTGQTDSISRVNSAGHFIGSTRIAIGEIQFPWGPFTVPQVTGMIDGESVNFDPVDLNEAGIVVGKDGRMVIHTPGSPDQTIDGPGGVYALAINDHARPAPSQPSATATPQPTPIPAPQILSWVGNALVLWELQPDSNTWHPFGLEEMIPSMDGWDYLAPSDMNDNGLIVGTAWYTDPSNPASPGEQHGFMLVPCELMVDGNRDGEMSFTDLAVHQADQTSEERPYRFWVNDDDDGAAGDPGDHVPPRAPDYADGIIRSIRDLEDFTRLHVNIAGLETALESNTIQAAFEWRQTTNNPRIKLYRATSAGISYLSDELIANAALLYPFRDTLGEVSPGVPLFMPSGFWVTTPGFSNVPKTLPQAWFLFEGSGEGKGQLLLSFWRDGRKIGETAPVHLELKNIKRMFQRAKGVPLDGVVAPWSDENPLPTAYIPDPNGYEFDMPQDESHEVIIFVHGIHPPLLNGDDSYLSNVNTAETVYKRLWHKGYKGRLALYKWPALNPAGYFLNGSGFEFNQSEYRGFKYGKGLAGFAASLPASYNRHIYAHSQGNAVAAAAFRNYGLTANTWIVTQGAIPISCFDDNLRNYVFDYITPDSASGLGYRGFLDDKVQTRIVNFCNNEDTITGKIWELNHELFKPTVHLDGFTRIEYWFFKNPAEVHLKRFFNSVELSDRLVNDPHESMAMAVKSRSRAIAHGIDVQGKLDEIVDLHATFGFGDEHGSQWERPIQGECLRYFEKLTDEIR